MRYITLNLMALLLFLPVAATADTSRDVEVQDAATATDTVDVAEAEASDVGPMPVTEDIVEPGEASDTEDGVALPETDEDAGAMFGQLLEAAQEGAWTVFAGLLLLLVIWLFNRLGLAKLIGRKWVPWVSVVLGAAVFVGISLATGHPVLDALKAGVIEGGLAIGLWELVFKHFTKHKVDGTPR